MKKTYWILATILMLYGFENLEAAPLRSEEPFTSCADDFIVTLTTFSYTQVPSSPCSGRFAIQLRNPSTNSGEVVCVFNEQGVSTTPTWAAGEGAFELAPGNFTLQEAEPNTRMFCYSLHTATEDVSGQELKPASRGGW